MHTAAVALPDEILPGEAGAAQARAHAAATPQAGLRPAVDRSGQHARVNCCSRSGTLSA